MTAQKFYTIPSSTSTVSQREAFNAIVRALGHRQIDFFTAVELSDRVKVGQVREVIMLLDPSDEPN